MRRSRIPVVCMIGVSWLIWIAEPSMCAVARQTVVADGAPLPGTARLDWTGDLASRLVTAADEFLLRQIVSSSQRRERHWKRDLSSAAAYARSIEPNRRRLAHLLGVRDSRIAFDAVELVSTTTRPALVGRGAGFQIHEIRWPAFGDVHGEGLLLVPDGAAIADIIALPDADQTPEQLAGLTAGIEPASQFARRLAESGCRVLVPALIDRRLEARNGRAVLSNREFLYRSAFELGRQLSGYEVQKVLALVDCLSRTPGHARIAVMGWGEGGLIALYAAALDERIDAVCVSGAFDGRMDVWQEPIDRNVFGLLDEFGGAELAAMVAPRALVIETCRGPELSQSSKGGAPAKLVTPPIAEVKREIERARGLTAGLQESVGIHLVVSGDGRGPSGSTECLQSLLSALRPGAKLAANAGNVHAIVGTDPDSRQKRQIHEIDRHSQFLLSRSSDVRREFMSRLDTRSLDAYARSTEEYRRIFYSQVIGRFDLELAAANPRSRLAYESERWRGYEVVLDVFDGVPAYGILLLPRDLKPGEKRPVVVCQHGLEGRPQDVVLGDNPAYHAFAASLADRGFITFAPQNLYIFGDRFRTLQRKANPLGKTLFSIITPQHQQIINWLKSLPGVDSNRIAFYGLSYGGKTAMRVPALLPDYCLSICSADFNEWVWKNASTSSPYSYVWTGEYEIFEFDLGSTFNYAEMAALIAPRPFMVERGHFDGVAPDEMVAYEFAKVRYLYEGKLGIGDRCRIEFFTGPHTINGKGTFEFLHEKLKWPAARP